MGGMLYSNSGDVIGGVRTAPHLFRTREQAMAEAIAWFPDQTFAWRPQLAATTVMETRRFSRSQLSGENLQKGLTEVQGIAQRCGDYLDSR
jgi:hypothetical protein